MKVLVVDITGTVSAQTFALAVRRRAENRATNCNLSCDWMVSVKSGKCKICRK